MSIAADGIEIDVERDGCAFGWRYAIEVYARARECPFLGAEQTHANTAPAVGEDWRKCAGDGEHDNNAGRIVERALGEVVPVEMGAQRDSSLG